MSSVQLALCRLSQYREDIRRACDEWGEDPFLLAAICLRESEAGYSPGYEPQGDPCGWGDGGNGYGLFQIDKRYHPDFVSSGRASLPANQARYACWILHQAREYLRRSHTMADRDCDEAAIAAYNAGPGNVRRAVELHHPVDSVTTHQNYSADVLSRATKLRDADPHFFDAPRIDVA